MAAMYTLFVNQPSFNFLLATVQLSGFAPELTSENQKQTKEGILCCLKLHKGGISLCSSLKSL